MPRAELERNPARLELADAVLCGHGAALGDHELERPFDHLLDPRHVLALFLKGQLLADRHRYRDAIGTWQRVIELEPDGDHARRARRESRTAADLLRIFKSRQEVA